MTMHNPAHPGETLREDVLPALKLTTAKLAQHLSYSPYRLSRVLKCRAAIRADLAWRLELAGLGSARHWLAQQAAHDLWQAQQREVPRIIHLDGT